MPHSQDRRSHLVEITDDGLRVIQQVRALVHTNETEWLARFSDDELRALIATLHRIQDALISSEAS